MRVLSSLIPLYQHSKDRAQLVHTQPHGVRIPDFEVVNRPVTPLIGRSFADEDGDDADPLLASQAYLVPGSVSCISVKTIKNTAVSMLSSFSDEPRRLARMQPCRMIARFRYLSSVLSKSQAS